MLGLALEGEHILRREKIAIRQHKNTNSEASLFVDGRHVFAISKFSRRMGDGGIKLGCLTHNSLAGRPRDGDLYFARTMVAGWWYGMVCTCYVVSMAMPTTCTHLGP